MPHVTEADLILHERTTTPAIVASLMLLVAADPFGYSPPSQFYDLLRLVVASAACYIVFDSAGVRRLKRCALIRHRDALRAAYYSQPTEAEFAEDDESALEDRLREFEGLEEDEDEGASLTPERIEMERTNWLHEQPTRLQQWMREEAHRRALAFANGLQAEPDSSREWWWTWIMVAIAEGTRKTRALTFNQLGGNSTARQSC